MKRAGASSASAAPAPWSEDEYWQLLRKVSAGEGLSDGDLRSLLMAHDLKGVPSLQARAIAAVTTLQEFMARMERDPSFVTAVTVAHLHCLWAALQVFFIADREEGRPNYLDGVEGLEHAVNACLLHAIKPDAVRGEKDKADRRYGPEYRKRLARERAEPKRDAVQAFARERSARGLSRTRIIELGAKKLGLQKTVFEEFAGEALPPSQKKKTPGI